MYVSLRFYKFNTITVIYTLNREIIITTFKGIKAINNLWENIYLEK
ncbi:replication protein [Clostridium sporogenes]|nr:replication protein [Clostridium sporogenes]